MAVVAVMRKPVIPANTPRRERRGQEDRDPTIAWGPGPGNPRSGKTGSAFQEARRAGFRTEGPPAGNPWITSRQTRKHPDFSQKKALTANMDAFPDRWWVGSRITVCGTCPAFTRVPTRVVADRLRGPFGPGAPDHVVASIIRPDCHQPNRQTLDGVRTRQENAPFRGAHMLGECFKGARIPRSCPYYRNGTANRLMAHAPLPGRHYIKVTKRRTKQDFAGLPGTSPMSTSRKRGSCR